MPITLTREEAQQVLDALNRSDYLGWQVNIPITKMLRARLAQPETEPVAWFTEDHREDKSATTYSKKMSERWKEKGWPVTPLYTAPPQREWQGLTMEEVQEILTDPRYQMKPFIVHAVEAKLKEKNT